MSLFTRRKMLTTVGGAAALAPVTMRGSSVGAATTAPAAGSLVTLRTPLRMYDSRTDTVLLGGDKITSSDAIIVTITVPDETRFLSAAFLNVTATETEGAGYLRMFGTDSSGTLPVPETSNLNWYQSGQTVANLALTDIGAEFGVEIRAGGGGRTHLIVDLQGYVPFDLSVPT